MSVSARSWLCGRLGASSPYECLPIWLEFSDQAYIYASLPPFDV